MRLYAISICTNKRTKVTTSAYQTIERATDSFRSYAATCRRPFGLVMVKHKVVVAAKCGNCIAYDRRLYNPRNGLCYAVGLKWLLNSKRY